MQQLQRNSHPYGARAGRSHTATSAADTPQSSIKQWRWLFIVTFLAVAFACPATATEVEIRVVDQTTGKPLTNAAVCLGTSAETGQFGRVLTSNAGIATFTDVPNTPLLLTISKPGFEGYQRTHSAGDYNRVIQVRLSDGVLDPICRISKPPAKPPRDPHNQGVCQAVSRQWGQTQDAIPSGYAEFAGCGKSYPL